MAGSVNKSFAYKILKEGLFDQHNITIQDGNLFDILNAGAEGDKAALKYLENSTEVKQLLEVLQGINDTYTPEIFDQIRSYLKENPEVCNGFYFTFDDFYQETFSDMLHHLQNHTLQLQSMDDILYLTHCISDRREALKKIDFPKNHNELTFVVKVTFDLQDGALVHQVFMGKTEDIDTETIEKKIEDDSFEDDEDDTAETLNQRQDPFNIDKFISIWSKRTCDKKMALVILKNMSYGDTLFSMFDLEESALHK